MTGRFEGEMVFKWLPGGRLMQLTTPFSFIDQAGLTWPVPIGTIVDGATIPRLLWTPVGGPYEGKYRDASVVHDYYCDVRTRPWQAVHRVFYEAMLAVGEDGARAKAMYLAVRGFGPRWTTTASHNTILFGGGKPPPPPRPPEATVQRGSGESFTSEYLRGFARVGPIVTTYHEPMTDSEILGPPSLHDGASGRVQSLGDLQRLVIETDPPVEEVEAMADRLATGAPDWKLAILQARSLAAQPSAADVSLP
jgi:hypothetical protein